MANLKKVLEYLTDLTNNNDRDEITAYPTANANHKRHNGQGRIYQWKSDCTATIEIKKGAEI